MTLWSGDREPHGMLKAALSDPPCNAISTDGYTWRSISEKPPPPRPPLTGPVPQPRTASPMVSHFFYFFIIEHFIDFVIKVYSFNN